MLKTALYADGQLLPRLTTIATFDADCAYSKGICSGCGIKLMNVKLFKQTLT